MGARGRTPKPAEIVELEDRRGTKAHREQSGSIVPEELLPKLPTAPPEGRLFRKVDAAEFYKSLVEVLDGAGVLRQTDQTLVIMLSEAAQRYSHYAEIAYEKEVASVDGQITITPFYQLMAKERTFLYNGLRELGLTPAARARVMRDVAVGQLAATAARRFEFGA